MSDPKKIEIENVMTPGRITRVDKAKYLAMESALLSVLPSGAPGITIAEAKRQLLPLLPQDLYPGGEKAGWWLKAAQLNLEAKGRIIRLATKPLSFHLA
ncbi:MAG: hypothetical protein KDJ19_12920 [Hyphomicrobiaceae bacterium]|nr:hypothetical protein [Hyphomicrobiaceae bacterium]MCC0024975.1 hypothetical protein [Hyphomicrobiaceae bacterium]